MRVSVRVGACACGYAMKRDSEMQCVCLNVCGGVRVSAREKE